MDTSTRNLKYKVQATDFLKYWFDRVSVAAIRAVLENNDHSFRKSFGCLVRIHAAGKLNAEEQAENLSKVAPYLIDQGRVFLKQPRELRHLQRPDEPSLKADINDIKEIVDMEDINFDDNIWEHDEEVPHLETSKFNSNVQLGEENGIDREEVNFVCGCCFQPVPVESLGQCSGGHMFCLACIATHAKHTVFEHRKSHVLCMSTEDECQQCFSESALQKAFPNPVDKQHIDKQSWLNAVKQSRLPNTSECPKCSFIGFVSRRALFIKCTSCNHNYCAKCLEPEHERKTCEAVKAAKSATKINTRNRVAELMTEAVIRECPGCQNRFTKVEGCNEMTCPTCETKSCFMCRQKISNKTHFCSQLFCNHEDCGMCPQFTDTGEDNERRARHEIARNEQQKENEVQNSVGAEAITSLLFSPERIVCRERRLRRSSVRIRRGSLCPQFND